uniref:histidine kinase n=1 Tax=Amphora coffeiformis TaxID=265554 RepID=A0A7S3L013_9STRA
MGTWAQRGSTLGNSSSPPSNGETTSKSSTSHAQNHRLAKRAKEHFGIGLEYIYAHRTLLILSTFIFLVITGAGVTLCHFFADAEESQVRDEALTLAMDTGKWFAEQLDLAILPLFSLAQFAIELEIFSGLPDQVGIAGEPGSLPFLPPEDGDGTSFRRNITGVCDDPVLWERFIHIASSLKRNADMEGVLVNLQLAPQAVVCLLHPLNNTEDFEDGIFMDNTGAWGMDLLTDPLSKFIAEQTVKQDKVSVAGPRALRQCKDCHPVVEQAFIARLPIVSPDHEIMIDGEIYNRWGFATALINWKQLVDRSGIYESFKASDMGFVLTRTDQKFDDATNTYIEEVFVLAETPGFTFSSGKIVSTELQTTNNQWEITVCYGRVRISPWKPWVITAIFGLSFALSVLIYLVLLQKHDHTEMNAKVETERNMTAYFAHELRNPLGAIDSAIRSFPEENLTEESKSLLQGMQLSCQFMSSIMNNLLDVRKMEEGKMLLTDNRMSLSELIQDVHQMLYPSVRAGVDFSATADTGGRDWVLGDRHRIQQALTNIATNAIKYTMDGSIVLNVEWVGDIVRFTCRDTGPGIPKKEQSKLFQRFVTRGGAPGTGLGLAITKNIVDIVGGSIRFESNPAKSPGTVCIMELPLHGCKDGDLEAETSSFAEETLPIEEPLEVLIVDDVKMNRAMFGRRIKKFVAPNCKITEATTGEEAIDLCRRHNFDVVIMDQYMSEAGGVMLGTDAVFAMRRMRMECIIVMCSGNDLDQEAAEAGADYCWKKPIPSNEEILEQFRRGRQTR